MEVSGGKLYYHLDDPTHTPIAADVAICLAGHVVDIIKLFLLFLEPPVAPPFPLFKLTEEDGAKLITI